MPVDPGKARERYDVIVVGAGFGGLYAIHRLRSQGLVVLGLEAAADVGGVWYHNRYPGARCDVESVDYSYSFSPELDQEWVWSERYAAQPEILRYIQHVADRFDLRRSILFETRMTAARHAPDSGDWIVSTDKGQTIRTRFVVMATGVLSTPKEPDFEGLDDFSGEIYQTSRWPHHAVQFSGKRVGIIGTGSSGLQSIPEIARQAEQLSVFQRTAVFTLPARNGPLAPAELASIKAVYPQRRNELWNSKGGTPQLGTGKPGTEFTPEERRKILEEAWDAGGLNVTAAFIDNLRNIETNNEVSDFVRERIRRIVKDPRTAELLCPRDHPISSRRICLDTGYFETYNRDNVMLVDVRSDPIERITRHGIQTREAHYDLDMIVLALGFDAFTGAFNNIEVRNGQGEAITDKWASGPRAYLGLMTAGFPNFFIVAGPGSPSVLANMVIGVEQHINWIADCVAYMDSRELGRIEAREDAQEAWVAHVGEMAAQTLYLKANSWYLGSNVPGKTRLFMPYIGGFDRYVAKTNAVAENDYEGFDLR